MPPSIINGFIQALDEEIQAIKRGKGGSVVKVFNGRFLREISGIYVYLFNLENFLAILDDSPAEIEIRGSNYPAQVLLTQGLEVEIGIERYCGEFIQEARLETRAWYLLELLKKKFSECQSGSTKVDFNLSELLFSGIQSDSKPAKHVEIRYSTYSEPPNEAQHRAIESSIHSKLSIIWGPPGTGKTRTIASAIEAHINAGRRVLLVSHANNAVDEALEDVAEQLKTTAFYQEGKLVRLGKPQEEHLKKLEENYELVLLDNIAAKIGESLTKEKNSLITEKFQIDERLEQLDEASSNLETYYRMMSEVKRLRQSLSESQNMLRTAIATLDVVEKAQKKNIQKLLAAKSSGTLKKIISGLDPKKIQQNIDQTSVSIDSKSRLVREIESSRHELKKSYKVKKDAISEDKKKADDMLKHLKVSEEELGREKNSLEKHKDTILARIAEINRVLDEMQKKVLSEAVLVATTLTKTFVAKQFPEELFDVLILDEASMAPLPHLYWAASRCRESATIVGDFLQLPPICIADDRPIAREWLGRSIFDVLGIHNVEGACNDKRVRLLDTQYRMAPAISAIPNRFFYQNKLKDDASTLDFILNDGVSTSPLILVDTATMNPWCSRLSTGSRFNLYNALLCVTLAKRISEGIPNDRIGILTPYGAQARLLNKVARDGGLFERLRISTIHRFQGGEEPIIIFDSVEGLGGRGIPPMLDDTKRDSDACLVLNVALTRAKSRIYLVANTKYLLSTLSRASIFARIIQHFKQNAEMLESENLVDNYFTTDFEKWVNEFMPKETHTREPISGDIYTERNFWAQFFQDLTTVKERLFLLSPFLSVRRSGELMNYFQSIIWHDADVRVYTRPRSQQTGEMANQSELVMTQLRNIGVNVIERRNMHQKIAILDNNIAWEGSLNILSHRDTGEHMRRFEGSLTIQEIIKSLELEEEYAVGTQTQEDCPGSRKSPNCDGYLVVKKRRSDGHKFLGCSKWPDCDYTSSINNSGRWSRF